MTTDAITPAQSDIMQLTDAEIDAVRGGFIDGVSVIIAVAIFMVVFAGFGNWHVKW